LSQNKKRNVSQQRVSGVQRTIVTGRNRKEEREKGKGDFNWKGHRKSEKSPGGNMKKKTTRSF